MRAQKRTVKFDRTVNACYISLSDDPVAETLEYSDAIYVDLNQFGVVVGIEVLAPRAKFPLGSLKRDLHIHSDDEAFLAQFLPNLSASLPFSMTSAADPTITARTLRTPQPA